ncbi:hypothetical protein JXA05_01330 [Candidatus Peregrinibacteria bacterium]|nr:hypothetical protein [Candidatus Peregrinibacteria bacterium]
MKGLEITPEDIRKNKDLAALSYVWVFSFIILLARRESPYIQYHAKQGSILFAFSLLFWPYAPFRYGEYVVLALCVFGFIQAAMGNVYPLPVIGDLAEGKVHRNSFGKMWHVLKHTAIRLVKPEHVTPAYRSDLQKQEEERLREEKIIVPARIAGQEEEKKISTLINRVEEEEKEIGWLKDEVKKLEEKVEAMAQPK